MMADAPAQLCTDNASLIQYPRTVQLVQVRRSNGVTSVSLLLHVPSSANVMACFSRTHPSTLVLDRASAFTAEALARNDSILTMVRSICQRIDAKSLLQIS